MQTASRGLTDRVSAASVKGGAAGAQAADVTVKLERCALLVRPTPTGRSRREYAPPPSTPRPLMTRGRPAQACEHKKRLRGHHSTLEAVPRSRLPLAFLALGDPPVALLSNSLLRAESRSQADSCSAPAPQSPLQSAERAQAQPRELGQTDAGTSGVPHQWRQRRHRGSTPETDADSHETGG